MGTQLLESRDGLSVNERVNYAVRAAIEAGIAEIIYEGETKGLWKFKEKEIPEIIVEDIDEFDNGADIEIPHNVQNLMMR